MTLSIDMPILLQALRDLAPAALTLAHVAAAVVVTLHALMTRSSVPATVAWIGVAWLAPVAGPVLYLTLGINRIQRAGVALGLHAAWRRERSPDGGGTQVGSAAGPDAPCDPELAGITRLARRTTGYTLHKGNTANPLVDGDEAYPAMLAAIDEAAQSVTLASYIFDKDDAGLAFSDALARAGRRGVSVRVLVDAVGARYSRASMVEHLNQLGISAAAFLPPRFPGLLTYANLRNHRKIMVVDGQRGFTGGMNIRTGHWLSRHPASPVRCLQFEVRGPVVADMQRTFAIDWAFSTGEALRGNAWFPAIAEQGTVLARGVPDGPDADIDHMRQVILGALTGARRRVRIVTPYFLPDEVVLTTLRIIALRGVDVDIVLPAHSNLPLMDWAMRPQLGPLLEAGCGVHLSPPPFDHTKLFLVDDAWTLIGSTNWDARSLRLNFEFNLECQDASLVQRLDELVQGRLAHAERLTAETLARQRLPGRLRDRLVGLLSPYL